MARFTGGDVHSMQGGGTIVTLHCHDRVLTGTVFGNLIICYGVPGNFINGLEVHDVIIFNMTYRGDTLVTTSNA